jgi:hypothetical protein
MLLHQGGLGGSEIRQHSNVVLGGSQEQQVFALAVLVQEIHRLFADGVNELLKRDCL